MQPALQVELPDAVAGYAFGDVHVDLEAYRLTVAGSHRPIEPKTFELLTYLIARRRRVVTKRELHQALWDGRAVCEGALSQCVWTVRKAIGDGGRRRSVIRTVHGIGYQFIGPVTVWAAAPTNA